MSERGGLVSIVMPAFRAARWLPGAVASVREQTYTKWELLIVDDRSPDDTFDVATRLAEGDPRIVVLRSQEGGGPSAARAEGLAAARGRYVAFLDCDDLWLPPKLERQLADLAATGAALSFTAYRRIDAAGTRVGRLIGVPRRLDHAGLLGHTAIVTSSVLVDRDVTGEVIPRPTYHDDFVLWLDILRPGRQSTGLNEDLVRYRVAPGSYSRNKARMAWHVWRTYRDIEGLGVGPALWYLAQYGLRGGIKYLRF